jgi:hypothetical protein
MKTRFALGALRLAALPVCLLIPVAAQGATILSPISASASSTFPGFPIGNTINQSGLQSGFVSGVTDFDVYLATNPLHTPLAVGEWFSAEGVTSATLTFDLGSVYTIDRLAMWNEEFSGIPMFNVLVSTDGTTFTSAASGLTTTDIGANQNYPAQVFNLGTQTARFIQLQASGCPQAGGQGHNGCGLGEIAFATSAATTAPEPASMLLLGVGLAGAGVRRWRQKRA